MEARKWSMFLSIMGFISIGFLLLAAVFMGLFLGFFPSENLPAVFGVVLSFVYLIMAIVYFFPILYLLQFSQKAKKAITDYSSNLLVEAIGKLKSHYKFFGITTIVIMAAYPLIIIVFVIVGVSTAL